MTDLSHEANTLVSETNRLIDKIQDKGVEVSRLESSRSRMIDGEDPTVFESRLRQARNALSALIEDLRRMAGRLSEFESRMADLSSRYSHDAGLYTNTARQKEVAGVPGARYQVQQAAAYAKNYTQEYRKQADEIHQVLQRAQSVLNQDFSSPHSGLPASTGNLDDLVGDALKCLGNSPSSCRVDVGSYVSYQPSFDYNISCFPGYLPGTYSLYDSGKYNREGHGNISGMGWIK